MSNKPLRLDLVFIVYSLIAAIAMIWDGFSRSNPFYAWSHSELFGFVELLILLVFVGIYVFASVIVSFAFEWGRRLDSLFQSLLTPISYFQISVISLLSGFVEEWFFRGILMSHLGIMISSLIFALCHLIPSPKLWIWSLWTFVAGILFGLMYYSTGSLILCALAHAFVNGILLVLLNRRAYETPSFKSA